MRDHDIRRVAVIDIGKTNAKLALVDLDGPAEVAVRKTPNVAVMDGPYPHHDTGRLWSFILDGLAELAREAKIDAISVTTHGATAALVDGDGGLALPVLDYEFDGPDRIAAAYDAVRPPFEETGSPRLPMGLNLGAQLFWQQRDFPKQFARVGRILTYPQYWAFRLCGTAANEVTSLGCHTDLWNPYTADFSTLADRMGWRRLFAPVRRAGDRLGAILPEAAARTGLAPRTPVLAGIHDSNASLYPHLISRKPPFAVVSTGTWVVAMAIGIRPIRLDPTRDTLVNVSALGDPVPSARFMGGREYETLTAGLGGGFDATDMRNVLAQCIMLLPSVQQGSGPFPNMRSRWIGPHEPSGGERIVAAGFYLALMTATLLELIGAQGPVIVEGPFARNAVYIDMLRAATGRAVLAQSGQAGTSVGAALLARTASISPAPDAASPEPALPQPWGDYAAAWRGAL